MIDVETFIEHYGKKGMHWGVRTQTKPSSDYKKTAPYRGRHPSELTNHQLREVASRITLETNYSNLHASSSKMIRGDAKAKAILGVLGTATAFYGMAKSPAGQAAIHTGKAFVLKMAKSPLAKVAVKAYPYH